MTTAQMLDPVRAAGRHEAAAAQAAAACRDHDANVAAAQAQLTTTMLVALKGPADRHIATPGNFLRSQPVSELLLDLTDEQAAVLFAVLRDAAAGQDVQLRAQVLQRMVAKTYGTNFADAAVLGAGEVL